jgi:hypothetical protein
LLAAIGVKGLNLTSKLSVVALWVLGSAAWEVAETATTPVRARTRAPSGYPARRRLFGLAVVSGSSEEGRRSPRAVHASLPPPPPFRQDQAEGQSEQVRPPRIGSALALT